MTRRRLTLAVLMLSAAPALGPSSAGDAPADNVPAYLARYMVELVVRAVREQDGQAIPRTELFVSGGNEAFGRWEKRVTTDASGMARVRLPMGEYRVHPLDSALANVWAGSISLPQTPLATHPRQFASPSARASIAAGWRSCFTGARRSR